MDELLRRMHDTYRARGFSEVTWRNDSALLRRLGHPAHATPADVDRVLRAAPHPGSKQHYAQRLRSMFRLLREMGEVDNPDVEKRIPRLKKPRRLPRPISAEDAALLMSSTPEPMRSWFVLGCLAGLRALEVSRARSDDLGRGASGGWEIRVWGKGNTELVIPAHPRVVEVYRRRGGPLWDYKPNTISTKCGDEMRRLGVYPDSFHACRHRFATAVLEASGWDLLTTSRLMRHASVDTTTGYAMLRQDRPGEVVASLPA